MKRFFSYGRFFLATSLILPCVQAFCVQALAQTSVSLSVGIKQTACATSVHDDQNGGNASNDAADGRLNVSPNPSGDGQIVVEMDAERNNIPQGASVLLRLINTRGEAVWQDYAPVLATSGGKWRKTVNVGHLAQGAYLLTLEAGSRKWSRKVVMK